MADRLDSLAPKVQDVMTQLEATGDTAKDIRDAIHPKLANHEQSLQELDSMRTELQRLQDQMRDQLGTLQRQVEGYQDGLADLEQVETRVAARLTTFESNFGLRTETSGLPRASFSPPVPNRTSFGRGREGRGSFGSQGAYESSRGDQRDFGPDYAETLRLWRARFDRAVEEGRLPAGFDARFVRLWRYYLAYCEAGFRCGNVNVHQVTLVKNARREGQTICD